MSYQKTFKQKGDTFLTPFENTQRTGIVFFLISLFLHALFFFGLIFFQKFSVPEPLPSVIQIDLVSLSPEGLEEDVAKTEEKAAPKTEEGVPVKATAVKKEKRKVQTIKPDISLKTKPKNLKDLMAEKEKKKKEPEKKKEVKPEEKPVEKQPEEPAEKESPKEEADAEKALAEAREKIEKQVEERNRDRIAEALSRLKQTVKTQDRKTAGSGSGGRPGYGTNKPLAMYKEIMKYSFQKNWAYNDIMAGLDKDLEVRFIIKILKSGEIRDIIYETRSGNRYLDESAKKAIQKTNPLPPLPAGMSVYDLVIGFTPKGLK